MAAILPHAVYDLNHCGGGREWEREKSFWLLLCEIEREDEIYFGVQSKQKILCKMDSKEEREWERERER